MFEALAREIASAPAGDFWFASLLALCAASMSLRRSYRLLAHKRLIEDMPTTRLRAAAQGYVEVCGTARLFDGDPIRSPLTQRACCWYRFSVEQRDRSGGRHRRDHARWTRVDGGESSSLFMLDDGTGRCAVDPDGATITPSVCHVWYGRSRLPPRLRPQRRGWSRLFAWQFGGDFRYREETIDIGAPLYALGFFRTHGGAATPADTSGEASALLREWKSDRAGLLARYDANRDGEIDAAEWERARLDAQAVVMRERATQANAPPAVDMLSRPESTAHPYILAARHVDDLLGHHAWSGVLSLGVGLCLGVGLTFLLMTRFLGAG